MRKKLPLGVSTFKKIVEENINTSNDQDIIEYLDDKLEDQDFENE